jgi:hypothetical protein
VPIRPYDERLLASCSFSAERSCAGCILSVCLSSDELLCSSLRSWVRHFLRVFGSLANCRSVPAHDGYRWWIPKYILRGWYVSSVAGWGSISVRHLILPGLRSRPCLFASRSFRWRTTSNGVLLHNCGFVCKVLLSLFYTAHLFNQEVVVLSKMSNFQ